MRRLPGSARRPDTARATAVAVAAIALLLLVGHEAPPAYAASFVVNTTADANLMACAGAPGDCSLRGAISNANGNPGADTITFDPTIFPTGAPATITLGFPALILSGGNDTISGAGAGVIVDGVIKAFDCFTLSSSGNTIKGLQITRCDHGVLVSAANNTVGGTATSDRNVISGNGQDGVYITGGGATGNTVAANYIGTNASGTAAVANSTSGVLIDGGAAGNTVGGAAPGAGNVISGNGNYGVHINGPASNGNTIAGNLIGTNATGTAAIGNNLWGVRLDSASNVVGGTSPGAGNVLSGNQGGVMITGADATGNAVLGNYIGTDATGTSAIPNTSNGGVEVALASGNTIGGSAPGAGNVISGNTFEGVFISGTGSGNTVMGNRIGTNAAGAGPLPNAIGVRIDFAGSPGNTVGGPLAGEANTIAYNTEDGVCVMQTTAGDSIRGNSIYSNGLLGIDLVPAGGSCATGTVTPNDPGDGDTGPNNLQNFPVITLAFNTGAATAAEGTLNSTAGTTFGIDFYSSLVCDPSGYGEGKVFLGSRKVTTVGNDVAFKFTDLPAVPVGQVITATATTEPGGDTSEFSQCVSVAAQPSAPLVLPAAMSGRPAPNGGTFNPNFDLGISGGGTAVFADTTSNPASGGVYLFFAGSPTTLAQQGDSATPSSNFQNFDSPVNNTNGRVAVRAQTSAHPGVYDGLFLFFAGSPAPGLTSCAAAPNSHGYTPCPLALADQPVPGAGGYTFSSFGPPVLNNLDSVVAPATYTNGPDTKQGLFLFFAGSTVSESACQSVGGVNQCALVEQGDPAFDSTTVQSLGMPVVNDVGQIGAVVTTSDSRQRLLLFFAGNPLPPPLSCQLANGWNREQECQLADATDPANLAPDGGTWSSFGDISMNMTGTIAAQATTSVTLNGGLFQISVDGTGSLLAKHGDSVPGGGTGTIGNFTNPAINDNGMVVARTTVSGGPVTEGMFTFGPGPAGKAVLQGDPAPGGGFYCSFLHSALNDLSELAFVASTNTGSGCTSQGVWIASLAVDSDGDGVLDYLDNCPRWSNANQSLPAWAVPAHDPDCDGFSAAVEASAGVDPNLACGSNAWPPDFNSDTHVNLTDVVLLKPHFNSPVPNPSYSQRFDLNADGKVNLTDVVVLKPFFSKSCTP